MKLTTNRLLLRDFTPDDADAFEAYHTDPRMSGVGWTRPTIKHDA